jgi:hypothetical protein
MIADTITIHSRQGTTATWQPWVQYVDSTETYIIPGHWLECCDIPDIPRPTIYQRKLELSRRALRAIVRDARVGIDSGEARSLGAMRSATAPRDPRMRPSARHHGWRESELRA